jgi:hypothetical protein
MEKSHEIPDWFETEIDQKDANFIPASTIVFERDGQYFFDGVIASLLSQSKIPLSIEIAMDSEELTALVRLNYGDGSDADAIYSGFELESFALLWNANPDSIHGLDSDRIQLILKPGEGRYPFTASSGVTCELFYKGDRFYALPHPDYLDELMEEAA